MGVQGVNSEAVVDDDGVPGIIEIFGEDDFARLGCVDRSTGGSREIHAGMRRASDAIQNPATSEIATGNAFLKRHAKRTFPEGLRRDGVVNGTHFLGIFFGALLLLRIGLDELLFHFEVFGWKFSCSDEERGGAGLRLAS